MSIDRAYAPRQYQYVTFDSAATSADANDANDVIFDKTLVPLASWARDKHVVLNDIIYLDTTTQAAAALTFWFFDAAITTFGTADAAPSISDGDSLTFLGKAILPAANQTALANNTLGSVHGLNMVMKPVAATTGLYVSMTSAGTPNHAGAVIKLRLGFIC